MARVWFAIALSAALVAGRCSAIPLRGGVPVSAAEQKQPSSDVGRPFFAGRGLPHPVAPLSAEQKRELLAAHDVQEPRKSADPPPPFFAGRGLPHPVAPLSMEQKQELLAAQEMQEARKSADPPLSLFTGRGLPHPAAPLSAEQKQALREFYLSRQGGE